MPFDALEEEIVRVRESIEGLNGNVRASVLKDAIDAVMERFRKSPRAESGNGHDAAASTDLAVETLPLHELLSRLVELIARYVVLPGVAELVAVALWIMHTHVFEKFEATPYLSISSAEKQSGKTRLVSLLLHLVARPWNAVLPSEAVVFRKIESSKPTLLLDEVDAIFGPKAHEHEGLRALLNAGFQAGSTVPRCVGKDFRIEDFNVFCPKALAGIGDLPDTVADRSIRIRMRRRAKNEPIEKFRRRAAISATSPIRMEIERWAIDFQAGEEHPAIPDELSDRAADAWEPLLSIAARAGNGWPERARDAAVALSRPTDDNELSLGVRLLSDLHAVWSAAESVLFTRTICERLNRLDEAPWGSWNDKAGIDARSLARKLRPYGVRSAQVRAGSETSKGYRRTDLAEAWTRYCPSPSGNSETSGTSETFSPNETVSARNERGVSLVPDVSLLAEGEGRDAFSGDAERNAEWNDLDEGVL